MIVPAGIILESVRHRFSALADLVGNIVDVFAEKLDGWLDDEMIVEAQGQMRVVSRAHDFMQLFAGTNADHSDREVWRHGRCEIGNTHRRDHRNEDLTARHALEALVNEVDALLKRYPEPRHAG